MAAPPIVDYNDYYMLKLNVNLTEDDSCLYKRFGSSIFRAKTCDTTPSCVPCGQLGVPPGGNQDHHVVPDASIVSVDIDRCDCTKAVFTVAVRLPCVKLCVIKDFDAVSEAWVRATEITEVSITSGVSDAYAVLVAIAPKEPPDAAPVPGIPIDCALLIKYINTLIKELTSWLESTTVCADADKIKAFITAVNLLKNDSKDCMVLPRAPIGATHRERKFCLVSGSAGVERLLVSFLVKPLSANVLSTGVVNECYTYEIARIVPRVCVPQQLDSDNDDDCKVAQNLLVESVCTPSTLQYTSSRLSITVPFTEQIKCLVPDFGLPGTLINSNIGNIGTIVKVVAQCPRPFVFPAVLYFDKVNCTACLFIDLVYLRTLFVSTQSGYPQLPYSSEFGYFGCTNAPTSSTPCTSDYASSRIFYDKLVSFDYMGAFEYLSTVRKFDVQGVHKCTDVSLFNFQICTVPQPEYCIDVCGKKIATMTDPASTVTSYSLFKVQTPGDYTYMFDNIVPS
jgi:hypothetical protein